MFIDQNDKPLKIKTDEKNIISFDQTHLEICMKLVETLEIENKTLHKSIHQMFDNQTLKNYVNRQTE